MEIRGGCPTQTVYHHGLLLSVTPTAPGPPRPEGHPEPGWVHTEIAKQGVKVHIKSEEELGLADECRQAKQKAEVAFAHAARTQLANNRLRITARDVSRSI